MSRHPHRTVMSRVTRRWLLAHSAIVGVAALGGLPFPAAADPTGGVVIGGQATITSAGPTTTITQTTGGAVIHWDDFSVGAGEAVRFDQPGVSAVTLNRVTGAVTSEIIGEVTATGSVFIENRSGVVFGAGAEINVGGAFIATTAPVVEFDPDSGSYGFDGAAAGSFISNAGSITAGSVALVAPVIDNSGFIRATGGDVVLGAATGFTVDFVGDGLITYEVRAESDTSLTSTGDISALGGAVFLSSGAAGSAVAGVVSVGGQVEATRIEERGGAIVLSGGETGRVDVDGTFIATDATTGDGGEITITGAAVVLGDNAVLDASAAAPGGDGGTVRIGGDFQGGGDVRTSRATYVAAGAEIRADGAGGGDGGTVIVWSDGATAFLGGISATAGETGGDGGFVEVSGYEFLHVGDLATIDTSAPFGETGAILFDPRDVLIVETGTSNAQITADNVIAAGDGLPPATTDFSISAATLAGLVGNVTIAATRDIQFDFAVTGATANFTFTAGRDIDIGADFLTTGTVSFAATSGDIITSAPNAVVTGSSVTYNAQDALALGRIGTGITGAVSITSGGAVTQLGGSFIQATGLLSVTTTSDPVTLGNAGNIFSSATISGAAGTTLTTTTGLALGTVGATSLAVNAGGAVTQTGALTLGTGALTVTATGFNITLDNAANTFGTFSATGNQITIRDSGALTFSSVTGTGLFATATDFTVNATGGNATTITLGTGTARFDISNGNDLVIGASSSGPDFTDGELEDIGAGTYEFRTASNEIETRAHDFTTAGRSAANLVIRAGGLLDITDDLSGIVNFTAGGSDVAIGTGDTVTASGTATLLNTAGDAMVVGGTADADPATWEITAAELGLIASTGLIVDSQGGAITLAALDIGTEPLSLLAGTGTLNITGNVTAGDLTITAADIGLGAGVTVSLDGGAGTASIENTSGAAMTLGGAAGALDGTFELTDAELDAITAILSFDAGTRDVTISGLSTARVLGLTDAGAVSFAGASTFAQTLDITGTSITDAAGATVAVTGLATLTTTGAVTLDNAGNSFSSVDIGASSVSLTDTGTLDLAGIAGAGGAGSTASLTVVTTGAITDSGPLAVSGAASFTTGAAADVTLDNTGNLLGSVAVPTADDVVIVSTGDVTLGAITAASLSVTATDVNLTGNLTLGGGSGTASFVNSAGDATQLGGTASATAGTFDIASADLAFLVAGTPTGTLSIDSRGGAVTVLAATATGMSVLIDANEGATNGTVTFQSGAVSFADLTVTGAASVSQLLGSLTVTGLADFTAAGSVGLALSGNAFGTFSASGTTISVRDAGALALGDITGPGGTGSATSLTVTAGGAVTQSAGSAIAAGSVTVSAPTFNVTLANAGNDFGLFQTSGAAAGAVTLVTTGDLDLGLVSAASLAVTAADVDIAAALTLTGAATFTNAAGDATAIGAATASATAGTFELTDAELALVTATARTFDSGGGALSVESVALTGPVTLDAENAAGTTRGAISFTGANSFAALTVTDASGITQAAGSSVAVTGLATLTVTGSVVLDQAANNLVQLTGTATALTLSETGGIELAGLTATSGDIAVTSTGSVQAATATTVSATGAVTLESTGAGTVGALGTAQIIADSNSSGGEQLRLASATGAVTGAAGTTLRGGSVLLDGATITTGIVTATASSVTAVSDGAASFGGTLTAATLVDVDAAGLVTFAAGSAGSLDVTGSEVDFTAAFSVGTGAASFTNVAGDATTVGGADTAFATDFILSGVDLGFLTSGSLAVTSGGGALTVAGITRTGGLTLDAGTGAVSFGPGATSLGALTVTAASGVTQTGALAVTGATSITATGTVTLANALNDFGSVAAATSGAVTLVDVDGITLGAVTASGLTVTATDIETSAAIGLGAGTASFTNSAGDAVGLGTAGDASEATFELSDTDISRITAGTLAVTTGAAGAVTVQSASVTGTLSLSGGATSFTGGASSLGGLTITQSTGVTQEAAAALSVTGATSITATGAVTLGAAANDFTTVALSVGTAQATLTDADGVTLGPVTAGGLAVTAGDVAISGAVALGAGTASFTNGAGDATTIGAAAADASEASFELTDADLAFITAGVLATSTAGDTTVTSATFGGELRIASGTGAVNFAGGQTSLGALTVSSSGGITQDAGAPLSVTGLTSLTSSGDVVLDLATNALASLSGSADSFTIAETGGLTLQGLTATAGDIAVTSTGSVQAATATTVSATGAVTLESTGAGTVGALGTAQIIADSNSSGGEELRLTSATGSVGGDAASTLRGASVLLDGATVATGAVTATGAGVTATATTSITFGGLLTAATGVDADAGSIVSISGGSAASLDVTGTDVAFLGSVFTVGGGTGTATFTHATGGTITLGGPGDASPATFEISAAELAFLAAGTLDTTTTGGTVVNGVSGFALDIASGAGTVTFSGLPSSLSALTIASSGGVTQTATVAVTGLADITSAGAVALGLAGNNFTTLTGSAASFAVGDTGGLTLGTLTGTTGGVSVTSSGAITVGAGTTVNAAGALALTGTGAGSVAANAASTLEGGSVVLAGASVATGTVTSTAGGIDVDSTAGGVTLGGVVDATGGSIDVDAVGGGITTTSNVTSTADILMDATGAIGIAAGTTVDAAGALRLASTGGALTAGAGTTLEGTSVRLAGTSVTSRTVTATGGGIDIDSSAGGVTLLGITGATGALDIDAVGGAISFGGQSLTAGAGALLSLTAAGNDIAGAGATLNGGIVTADGANIALGTATSTTGLMRLGATGTTGVTVTGALTSAALLDIDAAGGAVSLGGTVGAGAVDIDTTSADVTLSGPVTTTGAAGTTGSIEVASASGDITALAALDANGVPGNVVLTTTSGAVSTVSVTADGAVRINGGGGAVTATGPIVAGGLLGGVAVDIDAAGAVSLLAVTAPGPVAINAGTGNLTIAGPLTATGATGNIALVSTAGSIETQGVTAGGAVAMNAGGSVRTAAIDAGTTVTIAATGGSAIIGGDIMAGGVTSITSGTFSTLQGVRAAGDLLITAGTRIGLTEDLTVLGGRIVLTAGDSFGLAADLINGVAGAPARLQAGLTLTAIPVLPITGRTITEPGNVVFDVTNGFTILQPNGAATPALTVVLRDNVSEPMLPPLPALISEFGEFRIFVDQGVVAIGTETFLQAATATGFNPFTFLSNLTDGTELLRVEGHLGLVGALGSTATPPSVHVQNTSSVPNEGSGAVIAGEGRLGGTFLAISLFGEVNGRDSTNVAIGGFVQINTRDGGLPSFVPIPDGTANGCIILQLASCQAFGIVIPILDIEDGDLLNIRFVDPDEEEDDPFTNRGDEEEWN